VPDSHRRLRRPEADATEGEVGRYRREVAAALEAIGVSYGEEFVIVPAASFQQQETLEDLQRLGPFAHESKTSRDAALDAYPRQDSQRWRILMAVAAKLDGGGYTREELERITNLSGNTIRPRVQELIQGGFIEETDRTRPTRNGSEATVVNLTTKGRDEIRAHQEKARDHALR
jgi:DNA-binding MarR family transcriptional regulator